METFGSRRMCEEIVLQAMHDFDTAYTQGWIDLDARPRRELMARQAEVVESLNWFFYRGGIEIILEFAEFDVSATAIRRKIRERNTR